MKEAICILGAFAFGTIFGWSAHKDRTEWEDKIKKRYVTAINVEQNGANK